MSLRDKGSEVLGWSPGPLRLSWKLWIFSISSWRPTLWSPMTPGLNRQPGSRFDSWGLEDRGDRAGNSLREELGFQPQCVWGSHGRPHVTSGLRDASMLSPNHMIISDPLWWGKFSKTNCSWFPLKLLCPFNTSLCFLALEPNVHCSTIYKSQDTEVT